MDFALAVLILASVAAGVAGAVVSSWGLRVRLYNAECAITALQEKFLSAQRADAGRLRWKKDDVIEEAKKLASVGQKLEPRNPWDL